MQHISLPCNRRWSTTICSICPKAKLHRQSFLLSNTRANDVFELIHVDIWGAYRCTTYDGYKYFLTIVDDYLSTWVHLMSSKSNAFPLLQSFIAFVEKQFDASVKVSRLDNGLEFKDNSAIQFYTSKGIIHQKCIKSHVWTHHNKMGLLRENTNVF